MSLRYLKLFAVFIILFSLFFCGEKENPETKRRAWIEKSKAQLQMRVEQYHNYEKTENYVEMSKMVLNKNAIKVGPDNIGNSRDFVLSVYRSNIMTPLASYRIENISYNPDFTVANVTISRMLQEKGNPRRAVAHDRERWVIVYDTWFYDFTYDMEGWK